MRGCTCDGPDGREARGRETPALDHEEPQGTGSRRESPLGGAKVGFHRGVLDLGISSVGCRWLGTLLFGSVSNCPGRCEEAAFTGGRMVHGPARHARACLGMIRLTKQIVLYRLLNSAVDLDTIYRVYRPCRFMHDTSSSRIMLCRFRHN